jgi:hypothetical protein
MGKDLIAACQMFLVPMTILFAAIALARTEQLKTLISIMGLCTALAWLGAVHWWPTLSPNEYWAAGGLAFVFAAAWFISALAHFIRWLSGKAEEPPAQHVIVTMKQ